MSEESQRLKEAYDDLTAQIKAATAAGNRQEAEKLKVTRDAVSEQMKATAAVGAFGMASRSAAGATSQLTKQILEGKGDIKAFGGTIGDAAIKLGSTLATQGGIFGKVLGTLTGAAGLLILAMKEQAGQALAAKDDVGQLGTAGKLTAKDMIELANQAGYSTQNIDKFTNGVKTAGIGLLTIGKTSAEGAKRFSEIAAVGNDTIAAFRDMGISQERLTELQGEYVKNLAIAGKTIDSFGKNETERTQNLKKSSLEYASNLITLAGLTGKSIDAVEKEQKIATAAIDFQLSQMAIKKQIAELEKQDTAEAREKAKELQAEMDKREAIVRQITLTQGAEAGAAMRSAFATGGAITEQSEVFARAGIDLEKIIASTKDKTISINQAADQSTQLYSEGIQRTIDNLGPAAIYSADVAKQFGITLDTINRINQNGLDFAKKGDEFRREQEAKIAAAKQPGAEGKDPAEVVRRTLEETARNVTIGIDKAILSVNPIVNKFGKLVDETGKLTDEATTLAKNLALALGGAAAVNAVLGNLASAGAAGATGAKVPTRAGQVAKAAVTAAAGAGAEMAGTMAKEAGQEQLGSGLKVAGKALEGAALGRLIGIIHPALGTIGAVAGAAYGGIKALLEENKEAKTGTVESRNGGTFGMTGQLTEPKNTIAEIHKGEMVLTTEQQKELLSMDKKGTSNYASDNPDILTKVLTIKFDEMISKLDQMLAKSSDANDELKNSNRTLSDLLQYTRA